MARRSSAGWLIAVGAVGALAWAERRRALREQRVDEDPHALTNLAMAGLSTAVAQATMPPVVRPLTEWVERRRIGLTRWLPLPAWARDLLAVLLLDSTLCRWHVVEHRSRWLYRFHQVHHADLAMDTSTAVRFRFGEFLASAPWRAA
jgi:sterol desaturase/sphingolipid hydroxylase (fatty acid hydroxylase superfamily)